MNGDEMMQDYVITHAMQPLCTSEEYVFYHQMNNRYMLPRYVICDIVKSLRRIWWCNIGFGYSKCIPFNHLKSILLCEFSSFAGTINCIVLSHKKRFQDQLKKKLNGLGTNSFKGTSEYTTST